MQWVGKLWSTLTENLMSVSMSKKIPLPEKEFSAFVFNCMANLWYLNWNPALNIECCFHVKKVAENIKCFQNRFCWYNVPRNGVRAAVAKWLAEKIEGVNRYSDRVMKNNVIIRDTVWEVVVKIKESNWLHVIVTDVGWIIKSKKCNCLLSMIGMVIVIGIN